MALQDEDPFLAAERLMAGRDRSAVGLALVYRSGLALPVITCRLPHAKRSSHQPHRRSAHSTGSQGGKTRHHTRTARCFLPMHDHCYSLWMLRRVIGCSPVISASVSSGAGSRAEQQLRPWLESQGEIITLLSWFLWSVILICCARC